MIKLAMKSIFSSWTLCVMAITVVSANDCGLNSECRPVADCPLIRDNFNLIKRKPYCNLDRPGAHVCCRRSSQNSTQPTNVDLRVVRECRSYDSLPSVQRPLGEGCNYISNFIGRANAEPKEFPFTALVFNENPKGVANKLCGGVLISKKYVLTSVYCFVYDGFRPNWVRVGELDFGTTMEDASPQIIEIKNFIPHHQFRASELTIYHDIALVELAEEAVFDDYVRPACLSLEDGNDYQEFLSAGWDYPLPGHSSHLHKTKVNRLDDDKCYEKVRRKQLEKGINSRTHMCAIPSTGNISTCPGNGGTPLFVSHPEFPCQFLVVGILSIGQRKCGDKDDPIIYTRVKPYIDWIQRIVWN